MSEQVKARNECILQHVKAGMSYKYIAQCFGLSANSISRIARKHGIYKDTNHITAADLGGDTKDDPEWRERFSQEWNAAIQVLRRKRA